MKKKALLGFMVADFGMFTVKLESTSSEKGTMKIVMKQANEQDLESVLESASAKNVTPRIKRTIWC